MSVPRIPVRVTRMLIAPTVTVLTAVLVNKDLLEMVQFVKVWENVIILCILKVFRKVANNSVNSCFLITTDYYFLYISYNLIV